MEKISKAVVRSLAWLGISCALALVAAPPVLAKGMREEHDGWIYLKVEGSPREVGYQHGSLLWREIEDTIQTLDRFLKGGTQKDWSFFRAAAQRMFWPKLDEEYQQEIAGIAEGLQAHGKSYDKIDIAALNGWIELAWYYLPVLAERSKARPTSMNNKAPGKCSAFIATGSYTADGKIVMAHNNWMDYVVGVRWNVISDITPARGQRIIMDSLPGFIHSGDDFVINAGGLVYTETTIGQFKGFDEAGLPEFMRARKAAQYAHDIDEFVSIMKTRNNGGYANTWLVGDTRANEIAKLDLGLKNQRLWRTKDGAYVGANFGTDEKLLAEETTFDSKDRTGSALSRRARWEQLMAAEKGRIDAERAKAFLGDHTDPYSGKRVESRGVLCGHLESEPRGMPEFSWPAFAPAGTVQAKVTTAALAHDMKLWARLGHACGGDFRAAPFLVKHPEFKWQEPILKDMKPRPWTLVGGK